MDKINANELCKIKSDLETLLKKTDSSKNLKPFISKKYHNFVAVLVGNKVIIVEEPYVIFKFLLKYLSFKIGKSYLNNEIKKPIAKRCLLSRWIYSYHAYHKGHNMQNYKAYESDMLNLYRLAYEIYLLNHNGAVPHRFKNRLTNVQGFQSFRYELLMASFFLEAGFRVDWNKINGSQKEEGEFLAVHKRTKKIFSIETKCKTRFNPDNFKNGITRLIKIAMSKNPNYPHFIFIDVNFPEVYFEKLLLEKYKVSITGKDVPIFLLMTNFGDNYYEGWEKSRLSFTQPNIKENLEKSFGVELSSLRNVMLNYPNNTPHPHTIIG
jgi:hypothetical protein